MTRHKKPKLPEHYAHMPSHPLTLLYMNQEPDQDKDVEMLVTYNRKPRWVLMPIDRYEALMDFLDES